MSEDRAARRREILRRELRHPEAEPDGQHKEFVVLLGPSGCGKTTTLRAIAGLETIDRGDILIDGKPVQNLQPGDRDIAFVFQLFALYPHLTAYDNIAFPLRATRESREEVDRKVRAVARSLQIEHLLNKRPSALAGGDMQRIAIGRALVRHPKAMLMDEPIGALDAKLREEMRTELKRLHLENDQTPSTSRTTRSRPCRWPTASPS
jgi:multiple sugar transport system ATP-binding protein